MKIAAPFGGIIVLWAILSCQAGFAQISGPAAGLLNSAHEKNVKEWYTAFVNKDWSLMEQVLADGFTFSSPLDDHIDLKAFKGKCWPNAYKIKKVDVDKIVENGNDVFVIMNGWTTDGKLFRNTDYFQLKDGKIRAYECFFGPGVNYPNSGK